MASLRLAGVAASQMLSRHVWGEKSCPDFVSRCTSILYIIARTFAAHEMQYTQCYLQFIRFRVWDKKNKNKKTRCHPFLFSAPARTQTAEERRPNIRPRNGREILAAVHTFSSALGWVSKMS